MIRTRSTRTRRAFSLSTLEVLEGRALLTASSTALLTNPVAPPVTAVASPTTNAASADFLTASASATQGSAPASNSGGNSSGAAASDSSAPSSNSGGPTSGSSGTSGGDSSTSGNGSPSDGSGGKLPGPSLDPAGDALIKEAAAIQARIDAGKVVVARDTEQVVVTQGLVNADQANLTGLEAQEQTLTAQLNVAQTDSTANGQMVADYLRGELTVLIQEETGVIQQKTNDQKDFNAAEAQLAIDQTDLNNLNNSLADLRAQWTATHLLAPPPF